MKMKRHKFPVTGTVPTPPTDTPLSVMHSQWPFLDGTVCWLCPVTQGLSQHRPLTHLCQLCIVNGLPWTGLFGDYVQWHSDCLNAVQWFTKEGIVFYDYAHQGRDYFVTMSSERDWPTDQWFTTENTVTVTRYCFVTMLAKEKIVCDYVQWQELPQHCPIPHQGRHHYCYKVLFCDYTHQGRDCFVTIPIKEGTVLWLCSPRKALFCDYAHQGRGTVLWLCPVTGTAPTPPSNSPGRDYFVTISSDRDCPNTPYDSPRKRLFCDYAHQRRKGLFCDCVQRQGLLQHRPVTHQGRDCFVTTYAHQGKDCFVTMPPPRKVRFCDYVQWQGLPQYRPVTHRCRDWLCRHPKTASWCWRCCLWRSPWRRGWARRGRLAAPSISTRGGTWQEPVQGRCWNETEHCNLERLAFFSLVFFFSFFFLLSVCPFHFCF